MSSQVVVKIFDKHYTLGVDQEHSAEHVQKLAEMLDVRMHEIETARSKVAPHSKWLSCASLSLVEELLTLRKDYASAEADIASRTSQLAASLGTPFCRSKSPPVPDR